MKLRQPVFGTGSVQPESESDLISTVYHLVDCVARALPTDATPEALHYRAAGKAAFGAALAAEQRIAGLMERIAWLETTANSDDLTGLLNRRGFSAEIDRALAAARRYGENGMLIFLDLDRFKAINDTYGHAAGDAALCRVARILRDNVRETDIVGRVGGDEFAVLLTHTSHELALDRAEILDGIINTAHVSWDGRNIPLAASIGIQAYTAKSNPKTLVSAADKAMYKTKKIRSELLRKRKTA